MPRDDGYGGTRCLVAAVRIAVLHLAMFAAMAFSCGAWAIR